MYTTSCRWVTKFLLIQSKFSDNNLALFSRSIRIVGSIGGITSESTDLPTITAKIIRMSIQKLSGIMTFNNIDEECCIAVMA